MHLEHTLNTAWHLKHQLTCTKKNNLEGFLTIGNENEENDNRLHKGTAWRMFDSLFPAMMICTVITDVVIFLTPLLR